MGSGSHIFALVNYTNHVFEMGTDPCFPFGRRGGGVFQALDVVPNQNKKQKKGPDLCLDSYVTLCNNSPGRMRSIVVSH